MPSIKQNTGISMPIPNHPLARLPDFRNLGVCLRILVLVNLMAFIAAVLQSSSLAEGMDRLTELSAFLQPVLLLSLMLLYGWNRVLARMPYWTGIIKLILVELALANAAHMVAVNLFEPAADWPLMRTLFITLVMTVVVLYYFHLRYRALSPAIIEARLQALQARIRPHFLFNSIHAVLSLMRSHNRKNVV